MLSIWGDMSEGTSFTVMLVNKRSPYAASRTVLVFAKDYADALKLASVKAAALELEPQLVPTPN